MRIKRILAALLVLCMVFVMMPTAFADDTAPLATEDEIVVYYTNDVHCYIDKALSYDNIAALKEATAEQAAGVLLVDAGDHIQGTAYGSMDKGATIIELMNASGYDLATLGNHEFDYGMARALETVASANFPYVSANFYHEEDGVRGEDVLDAYKVFEVAGKKIAFVGITTPETFTKSTPAYFMDDEGNYIYGISGGDDGSALYADVQKAIDAAAAEGVDYIIALGHLGDDPASRPWTSEELIANTTGLDAFIDGHSHSTVPMKEVTDKDGNTVVLTQTGSYFDAVGRMSITEDGITTSLIKEYAGSDPEVKAVKDAWIEQVTADLGQVIGYTDLVFNNYDENGNRLVRKYETNTGDFCADAIYYVFDSMDLAEDVDVAIMNGGGVRNAAITGEISYLTCKTINTFGNVLCLQTVTGQQILDALEFGARFSDGAENGGFLHVSGLTYEIHSYVPNGCLTDDKGVWIGHEGEYRVQNVQILDDETGEYKPLDVNATYNLAGTNYTLRDLGDGYAMFDGAVNVLDYVMEDYQGLATYVKSFPVDEETGLPTITAENSPYANLYGEGRIKLVYFPDVATSSYSYDAVSYMRYKGLMLGVTNTTFAPAEETTRAMAVTVLYRLAGAPSVEGLENPFRDVGEDRYFTDAVIWAADAGVVNGYGDGTFGPNDFVTRADLVTMLYRYATLVDGLEIDVDADLSAYTDSSEVPGYALEAVEWAVSEGILKGVTETTLAPEDSCTREQLATFVYRYVAE